jgi:outer membrane protein OmpA-like peptidoglycan-associated protein
MNASQIFSRGLVILALFIFNSAFSQEEIPQDDKFYVVVGAFKLEKNVRAFMSSLSEKGLSAQHKFNADRQLYYVYTHVSTDKETGITNLMGIRSDFQGELTDSWLYSGDFVHPKKNIPIAENEQVNDEKKNEEANAWADLAAGEPEEEQVEVVEEDASEEEVVSAPAVALEPGEFRVYLNTTHANNGREITGMFKVIDMERNREHSTVATQELLVLKPKNGTNRVKFVSDMFGFKTNEHLIDLDEPLTDANSRVEVQGDTILVDFEMARYKKGEFAVLWQVFFYRDAAIMKEESVYELNQLLGMMRDDEKMRIKIHGHTNGNSHGKVLHLDLDDKQFFSLNGSHNEDMASAKKLSEYRAYTIQHWLMDQGVAEDRMEIVGWGGKKMLHDKHDDKAHQNVRVEIEVLESS